MTTQETILYLLNRGSYTAAERAKMRKSILETVKEPELPDFIQL